MAPDLADSIAVVCGGAGEVGAGVTASLLESGARVVVPSRSAGRISSLSDELAESGFPTDRLIGVEGDLSADPRGLSEAVLKQVGKPDLVVAALGGWDAGPPLADMPIEQWDEAIANGLRAHHMAMHAFVPALRGIPGASYVMVNGAAARYPVAGSGAVSTAAAGELMAGQVLAAEEAGNGIQVEIYVLGPIQTRSRTDAARWMASAVTIGETIAVRHARRRGAQDAQTGAATVMEILTAGDVGRARETPIGGLRKARMGRAGWIMWGLQTGGLENQVRRARP